MTRLSALEGSWHGRGSGKYPTIDSFEYEETLTFEPDARYPLIHYEQRTRLLPSGEPSHWESGFIRPLDDGVIEVSNSQDGGRVEVLRGRLVDGEPLKLVVDSVVLDHDPRLVQTRRILTLRDGTLRYEVQMSTRTTPEPRLQTHLEAVLSRVE